MIQNLVRHKNFGAKKEAYPQKEVHRFLRVFGWWGALDRAKKSGEESFVCNFLCSCKKNLLEYGD